MHTDTTTPVRWDTELGTYLVSGFDEASAMLRGPGWSSDPRLNPLTPRELRELPPGGVVFLDPPDHTRLRNLLSPPFTPRAIERLRPRVAAIADAVLDAVTEDDAGSVTDVVQEISQLVPLAVISELLDVGTEGAELFQAHTPALFRLLEVNPTAEDLTESVTASIELMLFLTPLLAERRQHPGDDFLSTLLAIEDIALDEVGGLEVLGQGTADPIGRVDLARGDPPPQRVGRDRGHRPGRGPVDLHDPAHRRTRDDRRHHLQQHTRGAVPAGSPGTVPGDPGQGYRGAAATGGPGQARQPHRPH